MLPAQQIKSIKVTRPLLRAFITLGAMAASLVFNSLSKLITYFTFAHLTLILKNLLIALDELANEDSRIKSKSGRYFYEVGTAEIARAYRSKQPLSLAYIDLDNFKEVNDTKGHLYGDQLLIDIASNLKMNLRQEDLLSRLGSDEFAILLVQTDQAQAKQIIMRLQYDFENAIKPQNPNVTFSIGLITYLADKATTLEYLVVLADHAMYDIKKSTKNSVQYLIF